MHKVLSGSLLIISLMSMIAQAAQPVKVGQIEKADLFQEVKAIAEVVSLREVELATEIEGKVSWVAEVGKVVKKNELVAELDAEEHVLILQSHRIRMEQMQSDITFSERERRRLEKLSDQRSTSEQDLDNAKRKLASLTHSLEKARVDERLFQLNVRRNRIVAPFDGQIVLRHKVSGAYLEKGEKMLTIVDIHHPEISAKLPVEHIGVIQPDITTVKVIGAGRSVVGEIKSVVMVGDALSRMVEVRILAPELNIPIGSSVSVKFNTNGHKRVWKIPRDAVVLRQNEKFVYQIGENNRAIKTSIKVVNNDNPNYVLVEADLNVELSIVIRGAEMLAEDGEVVLI